MRGCKGSIAAITLAALMLASCGGGGNGSASPVAVTPTPSPTPTPTPTATCSLSSRQAFAKAVIDEWYLFPNDVATNVNPASYSDVQTYIDALLEPARAQNKDRYFTYITSIAEEEAYYASGSSAGYGVRLAYDPYNELLLIAEAYEGAPALSAGIDRGATISAIGTSASTMRSISSIVAAEGTAGIIDALGPDQPGVTRVLRVTDASGTHDIAVTKEEYDLDPVSDRYGAKVISEGGRKYGYVNLRTFISSAGPQLRDAFQMFRDQGVTDVVVDLRYNGGGLVSVAELFGDLLGGGRNASDLFSQLTFRPEKSAENDRHFFTAQPEAIAPTRLAFIGTGSTASASELVINGMLPYLGTNMTLVGSNTYGKPVGQIALDKSECDDRMRVIAFALANADGQGDYYNGLASRIPNSCAADDDLAYPLGDPREASVRAAIDFLAGRACTTRIADTRSASADQRTGAPRTPPAMLMPAKPSTAQREQPGLY
ncbi:S41 family peptidase [Sphingopyxis indica]|uniref:Peptidase family S41 n=1 Tax=Sphingopyxis indica TaxID=436663 RepID=A0A239HX41_9SPHN|nr:S41 family peptidase [Sphingopyxis indica]SNS85628.1 Peptidase family S41 [Sphingopyxis indica]